MSGRSKLLSVIAACVAMLWVAGPAAAEEDPTVWDVTPPTLISAALVDPGPFEPGDTVSVAWSATDTGAGGGAGINAFSVTGIDSAGQWFGFSSYVRTRGQVQANGVASQVLDHEAVGDGRPMSVGPIRIYEVRVADWEGNVSTSHSMNVDELRFGYGAPATFRTVADTRLNQIGDDLSVQTSWSPQPSELSYVWMRDGAVMQGVASDQYTLEQADRGHTITVEVTGTRPGFETIARTTNGITSPASQFTAVPPTVISGTPVSGSTLTAEFEAWDPPASAYSYQWLRDGADISGATTDRYTVGAADLGHQITVRVTGNSPGFEAAESVSGPVWASNGKWPLYKNTFDGTIYELVTNGDGSQSPVHLTYERWRDVYQFAGFILTSTDFVKYPWSPTVYAVTFWPGGEDAWQWTRVSFDQWRTAGFPAPRVAGWIKGSSYHQWGTSPELFVRGEDGVTHKLTYTEWRDAGFREARLIPDSAYYKLSWGPEIFHYAAVSRAQGYLLSYAIWQFEDFPTPATVSRVPGDLFYRSGSDIRYRAPGVDRRITYAEWSAAGFPAPQ